MADASVTFLLENLKDLVVEQVKLIKEALSEVEQVLKLVEKLNAFLGDPAIQGEERFRVLAMEVREVVYAAQDISDSFLILELQSQLKRNLQYYITFLPNHLERRLSLAKQLIAFRKTKLTPMLNRVDHIKQFHMPKPNHPYAQRHSIQFPNQVPTISPDKIVGFKEEAETLIKNVMEESERLDVITITGMPGIGMTTLAWKIFRDQKIRQEFCTRIWINLPQGLERNAVYLHIQKELTKQEQHYGLPDDYDRQDSVVGPLEFLRNIKFLLVLDNVWTVDDWNAIKDVLPMGNKSGKVLITSQNERVCMLASRDRRKPLKLGLLSNEESWELLQLQVFGKLNILCPHWLDHTGKTVAKNCDGLPLAIQIIATSLVVATSTVKARELTVRWWEKVGKNVSLYVTEYYQQQGASSILELSYNILPQKLRDCFLYLGVFPEDYEIPTSTLTRLWIAEGFIRDTSRQILEETAEDVLRYLLYSNLVMACKLYYNGKVKTCRVHKVIHGFCKAKALELNLFQEVIMSDEEDFDPPLSLTPNYRRLCIHSNLLEYLNQKPYVPGVRSFLCFQTESNDDVLETIHTSTIHKTFKFLKVFESQYSIKFAEFPIKLTRLMNLTYISLSCDHLSLLPETICHLLNLQTLIVETLSPVLEIKGNIWRMIKLRHLITKAAITLPKKGEAGKGGGELQTLTRLSPEYCNEDVFSKAPKLRKLGIRGKQLATLLATDSLGKLNHLESLKLENESLSVLTGLHPSCFPSSLTSITLSATSVDRDSMLILGKMDNLRVLKLKGNAGSGESWNVTDAGGFPNLELLFIGSTELVSWEASPYCFPRLRFLVLKNCGKLENIPLSLAGSLETLELEYVTESAVKSATKIKEIVHEDGLRELNLSILPEPDSSSNDGA